MKARMLGVAAIAAMAFPVAAQAHELPAGVVQANLEEQLLDRYQYIRGGTFQRVRVRCSQRGPHRVLCTADLWYRDALYKRRPLAHHRRGRISVRFAKSHGSELVTSSQRVFHRRKPLKRRTPPEPLVTHDVPERFTPKFELEQQPVASGEGVGYYDEATAQWYDFTYIARSATPDEATARDTCARTKADKSLLPENLDGGGRGRISEAVFTWVGGELRCPLT